GGYEMVGQAEHQAWLGGYLEANRRLSDAIAAAQPAPDAFLVQDYHLYPLPALLRAAYPDTPILHFTHIPFPDPPVLRLLPRAWRDKILTSLLQSSVVGLQTAPDVRAFLACCEELLGLPVDTAEGTVCLPDGRQVRVAAYPASVDPRALQRSMQSVGVARARARLEGQSGRLNIIRVDRLDP